MASATLAAVPALPARAAHNRTRCNPMDGIRYLGGGTSPAGAGGASWLTWVYALQGLRDFPGRKVVVLFSEDPGLTGPPPGTDVAGVANAAHAAAAGGDA